MAVARKSRGGCTRASTRRRAATLTGSYFVTARTLSLSLALLARSSLRGGGQRSSASRRAPPLAAPISPGRDKFSRFDTPLPAPQHPTLPPSPSGRESRVAFVFSGVRSVPLRRTGADIKRASANATPTGYIHTRCRIPPRKQTRQRNGRYAHAFPGRYDGLPRAPLSLAPSLPPRRGPAPLLSLNCFILSRSMREIAPDIVYNVRRARRQRAS